MATELTVQSERAFQKQPIFLNQKTKVKSARPGKGGRRYYKDVGLGFKTPKNAIEGTYIGTLEFVTRRRGSRVVLCVWRWKVWQHDEEEESVDCGLEARVD